MRPFLMVILPLLVIVTVLVFGFLLWRMGSVRAAPRRHLDRAQMRHGAARVEALLACIEALPTAGDQVLIDLWPEVEASLLSVLPDCPPDRKPRLAKALEACHAATEHRQTQRAVMDLRRSLDGGEDPRLG